MEIASYGPGKMVITTQANRADLTWNVEETPDGEFSLGDARSAFDALIGPAQVWLQGTQLQFTRVALGTTFMLTVGSYAEGQQRLAGYLPRYDLSAEEIEDFQVQFNRVGSIEFRGAPLRTNRISRWRAGARQLNVFEFGPSGPILRSGPQHYVVECHQDFNTDVKGVEPLMSGTEAAQLARQLANEASLFLERGDYV